MPNLVIRHVWCHEATDFGGDDLTFAVKVDNAPGFTEVWKGDMGSGTGHRDLDFSYAFNSRMKFAVYDRDPLKNDLIGVFQVLASDAGTGEHVERMYGYGSNYEITWRVD